MYEENPYPRFKCTNFTDQKRRNPIVKYIENETSKKNLPFSVQLKSLTSEPKVYCWLQHSSQVIQASRYVNARS